MLAAVNRAITEIASGAASSTISTANGSKSYTRADLGTLRAMRKELRLELASYNANGRPNITLTGVRYV